MLLFGQNLLSSYIVKILLFSTNRRREFINIKSWTTLTKLISARDLSTIWYVLMWNVDLFRKILSSLLFPESIGSRGNSGLLVITFLMTHYLWMNPIGTLPIRIGMLILKFCFKMYNKQVINRIRMKRLWARQRQNFKICLNSSLNWELKLNRRNVETRPLLISSRRSRSWRRKSFTWLLIISWHCSRLKITQMINW